MGKRFGIYAALTCAALVAAFAARADDYPTRPIRLLHGFAAGGAQQIRHPPGHAALNSRALQLAVCR